MSWLRAAPLLLIACGQTESDGGGEAGGSAGQASAGTHSGGKGSGGAGSGTSGSTGSSGKGSGGSDAAGDGAGGAPGPTEAGSGGEPEAAAGASGELVDCNPHNILCRIAPPECAPFEVPMVEGTCYGPCVSISSCACATADDCPAGEPDGQYPCWGGMHCGPLL